MKRNVRYSKRKLERETQHLEAAGRDKSEFMEHSYDVCREQPGLFSMYTIRYSLTSESGGRNLIVVERLSKRGPGLRNSLHN